MNMFSLTKVFVFKSFRSYFRRCRHQHRNTPHTRILLLYFMSINVLFQGIVDIVLKVAGYTPFFVAFPWRVDFLFLTAVSVLLGWQTLSSMKIGQVDTTKNSLVMSFLVEIGLVVSDIYFVLRNLSVLPYVREIRIPFVILTLINVILLLLIMKDLKLYRFFEYRVDLFFKKFVLPSFLATSIFLGNSFGAPMLDKNPFDFHEPVHETSIHHYSAHHKKISFFKRDHR